eukprot:PhM_4_TR10599/c0_g1_i2/m.67674
MADEEIDPKKYEEDGVPEITLEKLVAEDGAPLCEVADYPKYAKALLRFLHPHPVRFVNMTEMHSFKGGRFQCDMCGNVAVGMAFHCFKCGYDVCEGCSKLMCNLPDDRELPDCGEEEFTRRMNHLHEHPTKYKSLCGMDGYGEHGKYYCDRCCRRENGSSQHCEECGFDLCTMCVGKVHGTFKFPEPTRRDAVKLNMKHRAHVRGRSECVICRAPISVGKEHRWFVCNDCPDLDVCWACFHGRLDHDEDNPEESHPLEHTWTDMQELSLIVMKEAKERAEKSAAESAKNAERLKIVPLERNEYKVPMASVVFCPQCGATFDIHNPHNPRNHPDPAVDPQCTFVLPIMENGGPLSEEDTQQMSCALCHQLLKAYLPVVAPACRHAFCADCIMRHLKTSQRCPIDGKPLKLEHLCKWPWLQNRIHNLEVACINSQSGCSEVCTIADFAMHTEECKYAMVACKFRSVGCYFVGPPDFVEDRHEAECVFQQLAPYIRRNEMHKKELAKEISVLRVKVTTAQEQLSILLQERDFCYSSSAFVVDEDDDDSSKKKKSTSAAATTVKPTVPAETLVEQRLAIDAEHNDRQAKIMSRLRKLMSGNGSSHEGEAGDKKEGDEEAEEHAEKETNNNKDNADESTKADADDVEDTAMFCWDMRLCDPEVVVFPNEDPFTVSARSPFIVLGTRALPMKGMQPFCWEVRINTYPGVASIRVGFARNPKPVSRATRLLKPHQPLGEDVLSYGWVSTGTMMHDKKFLCQNDERLRFEEGDYIGFAYVADMGDMHLYRNRVWVHKLSKLNRPYIDAVTKKTQEPEYFPAASVSYLHYSVTVHPDVALPLPADIQAKVLRSQEEEKKHEEAKQSK